MITKTVESAHSSDCNNFNDFCMIKKRFYFYCYEYKNCQKCLQLVHMTTFKIL